MIVATVAFLMLLPCAICLLGSVLGLLDRSDPSATLRRIAWRGLPFLVAGLALGPSAAWPALAAVLTALSLHVTVNMATRAAMRRGWLTSASEYE